jgi:alkanesulfonate monooxygenase SsuD/methylene tetrahydromethanopterin reductase-like flavin-dependent oxidoreductase (luciferase family)
VKLSAFSVVDSSLDRPASSSDRLGEVVKLAEAAEAGGLSALWVAEHHFHPAGVCPSPPVLLAACGARTQRLRLGSLVSVLPFHRPIDIAEEYAMVDRLIGGRLNLGVGSGYLSAEFDGFGVDPSTKRVRFDEALATILTAFDGGEVDAGAGPNHLVRLNVLPVQRPHPPLWVAVQRREAVRHVASRGLSIALIPYATVADQDELGEEIREYRDHLPPGVRGGVAAAIHVYAGEDPDGARRALRRYLESRIRTHSTFFVEKSRRDPESATPEALEEAGWVVIGTPTEVRRRLRSFEALGVDELLGIFDFGGLDVADVSTSVRALGVLWEESSSRPGPPASELRPPRPGSRRAGNRH